MTGLVDHSSAVVPHHCLPPAIHTFGKPTTREGIPTRYLHHPAGTRYLCDGCGTVWVVWQRPAVRGPHAYVVSRLEWRRETRAERRHRLGLHWWQRA